MQTGPRTSLPVPPRPPPGESCYQPQQRSGMCTGHTPNAACPGDDIWHAYAAVCLLPTVDMSLGTGSIARRVGSSHPVQQMRRQEACQQSGRSPVITHAALPCDCTDLWPSSCRKRRKICPVPPVVGGQGGPPGSTPGSWVALSHRSGPSPSIIEIAWKSNNELTPTRPSERTITNWSCNEFDSVSYRQLSAQP